jgi:hypothetical protein
MLFIEHEGDKIEEGEIDRVWVNEKWIQNFQLELERKRPFVDRRIILKLIVKKKDMRLWIEFSCLRIGSCEYGELLGCIKEVGVSLLAELLLAF